MYCKAKYLSIKTRQGGAAGKGIIQRWKIFINTHILHSQLFCFNLMLEIWEGWFLKEFLNLINQIIEKYVVRDLAGPHMISNTVQPRNLRNWKEMWDYNMRNWKKCGIPPTVIVCRKDLFCFEIEIYF